jgi:hypothetical protein
MFIETLLLTIVTMAFSQGLFLVLGFSSIVPRMIMESCIVFIFLISIYTRLARNEKFIVFSLFPMAGLFLTSLISRHINNEPLLPFSLFLRHTFVYYIFFIALLNLGLLRSTYYRINKYLIFLFIIQIPANIVKFFIVGQNEGYGIGTMSLHAGSLTTTFVLFALAFTFSFFFFKKRVIYFLLILGFLLFGVIGEKRAIPFYVPLLVIVIVYFYTSAISWKNVLLNKTEVMCILLVFILCVVNIYVATKVIPSLNPTQKFGGDFSPHFLVKCAFRKVTWTADGFEDGEIFAPESKEQLDHTGRITLGRYATTLRVFKLLKEAGPLKICFGFGAGNLVASSLLHRGSTRDITIRKFDIGYGITGFVWFALQIGLVGVFLLVWFYFRILKRTVRLYKESSSQNYKAVALGFLGANFVFLLDFLSYSTTTLTLGVLTPVYFYIAFFLFKDFIPENQRYQAHAIRCNT